MSDYIDTREGWREVPLPHPLNARPAHLIEYDDDGLPNRGWVREAPVLPLPTEENTVIEVTWRHGSKDRLWRSEGRWRNADGVLPYSLDQIIGFEVLAVPVDDPIRAGDIVHHYDKETAKAVLNRVRGYLGMADDDGLRDIAREFGVES